MSSLQTTLRMIKFEHSIFALPFALSGAWVAAQGIPNLADLIGILVAAVAARSAAMAFNRVADRDIDATNPRTQERELVSGQLSLRYAVFFYSPLQRPFRSCSDLAVAFMRVAVPAGTRGAARLFAVKTLRLVLPPRARLGSWHRPGGCLVSGGERFRWRLGNPPVDGCRGACLGSRF